MRTGLSPSLGTLVQLLTFLLDLLHIDTTLILFPIRYSSVVGTFFAIIYEIIYILSRLIEQTAFVICISSVKRINEY